MGTNEQVILAQQVISDLEHAQGASLNQLLNELRDDLREELQLGAVKEPLVFLRISEHDHRSSRYVGNKRSMEVHDRFNEHPFCHLQKIPESQEVSFASLEEARARGFDICAFCAPSPSRTDEIKENE